MSEPTDIEALAELIHERFAADHELHWTDLDEMEQQTTLAWDIATVLSSDWLARHDREVAERAWDEGYQSGGSRVRRQWSDEPNLPDATNPYRADAIQEGRDE